MERKIIKEKDYISEIEENWMKSVDVKKWEHNHETKEYIITYNK